MVVCPDIGKAIIVSNMILTPNPAKWVGWGKNTGNTPENPSNMGLDSEVALTGVSGTERIANDLPTQTSTTTLNDTYQVVQVLISRGSFVVTEAGLFDQSIRGRMLLRGIFTAISVIPNDSLRFIFRLQIL